ncbi:hypothetical protein HK100_004433 [Physocladia obscura]|uniref:Glycosyl transferase 64 domain-containing protein n=1 Tax=Physocladia obscura TaxID=109957 RepID=A0AAD5T6A6_9FUNG|nr:hypothetical protein HK100_004433 [Physocladia obscura]
MNAWEANSDTEFAIFLDSNTRVSPHFLEYVEQMTVAYLLNNASASSIMGISLHNVQFDQAHEVNWDSPSPPNKPYLLQFPQTHGMVVAPAAWRSFRKWFKSLPSNVNPLIPNSMTNRWNSRDSCKKYLVKFMYLHGIVMVNANFPNGFSLITRQGKKPDLSATRSEAGATLLNLGDFSMEFGEELFKMRMNDGRREVLNFGNNLPSLENLPVFNVYFQPVNSVQDLKNPVGFESFDKCTLLLNTYDRVVTLVNRVYHYETFPYLDRIIIVWNHQTIKPPFKISQKLFRPNSSMKNSKQKNAKIIASGVIAPEYEFLIPVHVLEQSNSSLNNRYVPFKEIKTDCVISMDDDFDYPQSHLAYSVSLFQGAFFNHAIGFRHMGRSHVYGPTGALEYSTNITNGISMVLPTGLIFHRKYLDMYTYSLPQHARDIVDSKTNGEDILFNLMVANATGSCPVVVNKVSQGIVMKGLWHKPKHFEARSLCLSRVVNEVFGGVNPLRFSKKYFEGLDSLPWNHVCIIGNAQHESDAIRSHKMWDDNFVSLWFVWGGSLTTPKNKLPRRIQLIKIEEKKSWAEGIEYLLNLVQQQFHCEYIFTHDDDLQFYTTNETDTRSLYHILTDLLLKYQPMIFGFPWSVGDSTIDGMKELAEIYRGTEVSPLTGFDSGMILYHKSIVEFFIPYTPRGEGGFNGHWSLCAHFITLFAPNIFHGAALRVNAIGYTNLISFDNVPEDERKPTKVSKNGLIVHAESRHPYEYHMNQPFRTFLSNGMLNRQQRWGRDMLAADLLWEVEFPEHKFLSVQELQTNLNFHRKTEKWTVLERIIKFYDIHHPVLSKNFWIRKSFTDTEIENFLVIWQKRGEDFSFIIHVFTLNRKKSLNILWASINKANRINRSVSIHIHLDTVESDNNAPFFFYIQYLQSLVSIHGPVVVSVNSKHKGLRQSIMDVWTPTSSHEYAIFLEDDISVSRHFLEFAEQMVSRYLQPRGASGYSPKCIGISLYNLKYDEVNGQEWNPSTNSNFSPYLLQHPQSWGAVYAADGWNDFKKWFLAQSPSLDPLIPNSLTNRWPKSRSWKKYLIRYMYIKGKVLLYPNFPSRLSFTTNRLEIGTNDKINGQERSMMLERFNIPLLELELLNSNTKNLQLDEPALTFFKKISVLRNGSMRLDLTSQFVTPRNEHVKKRVLDDSHGIIQSLLPDTFLSKSDHLLPMNQLQVFNAHFKPAISIQTLTERITPTSFDKCTFLLNVNNETSAHLKNALQHYQSSFQLDSIFVIWNRDGKPPTIKAPKKNARKTKKKVAYDYNIPIEFIVPKILSPNNKYLTDSRISSDCILVADSVNLISLDQLHYAISLFQGHFFRNLIGFKQFGYLHSNSAGWKYISGQSERISVVESAIVLHRKYLSLYSSSAGRHIVDEMNACDDILMNMLVANKTEMGPVVITDNTNDKRNEESVVKNKCLEVLSSHLFGKMPLKTTKKFFVAPKPILNRSIKVIEYPEDVTPALKHIQFE